VRVHVGTSGYSYKAWKGSFYPDDIKDAEMLHFYSQRFPTVEINNTFYRMPSAETLKRWSNEVPEGFTFVLKAPRRISHEKRLGDVADAVSYLFNTASELGGKLGPVLFQLPPFFKKDLVRLRAFLELLPPGRPAAFEFRHASWFDAEVQEALRAKDAALCTADTDDSEDTALTPTARWGYLRLRRTDYPAERLEMWANRIRSQAWDEAFVFFKHEEEGKGPDLAQRLSALLKP